MIWLSYSGGSGGGIGEILSCPHKYYLKRIEKWYKKRMSKPLAFGIAIHEAFLEGISFGELWGKGKIVNKIKDEEIETPIEGFTDEEAPEEIQMGERMVDRLKTEDILIKEHEKSIFSDLINPSTGNEVYKDEIGLVCREDIIEIYNSSEDLSDIKTSSSLWKPETAQGKNQIQVYRYIEACSGEDTHNTGHYLIITKQKTPQFQRFTFDMTDDDHFLAFDMFKGAADTILKCQKENYYPKNPLACEGMFGQLCEYHPICFPHRYSNPEEEINKTLIRRA